ncbi:VIT1/CCC1 transporter family protein [Paraburkholderia sp. RL17-373-BIF-A]|uniref:VIT1/CCC1 transporter family protein n=1 Tax=Paraburkholderia sp. RL17-373-BIF-A TaxID=3031629 RepID=UPI0038BBA42E
MALTVSIAPRSRARASLSSTITTGEYVSVSAQADVERAYLEVEQLSLQGEFQKERAELADIYMRRGLE